MYLTSNVNVMDSWYMHDKSVFIQIIKSLSCIVNISIDLCATIKKIAYRKR